MKVNFCAFVICSSLSLLISGCSDHARSMRTESVQELYLADNQIVNIMMTVDKGEIAAAKEAVKKTENPVVDAYANYLIQQHQDNLDELTKVAKQLKLNPDESSISKTLVTGGERDLKALEDLQGPAFDKAFIDTMVKEHREGLELIDTKLLPQTKNPQLRAFVEKFRSMVFEHLQRGLQIQKTL